MEGSGLLEGFSRCSEPFMPVARKHPDACSPKVGRAFVGWRSELGELEISNTAWAFARISARDERQESARAAFGRGCQLLVAQALQLVLAEPQN